MRSFLMILAVLGAMPACRTVDEKAAARAAATGVPKTDPDAVAFVNGVSAQVLFDSFDVPENAAQSVGRKTFEGSLVVSCSRSGKDVFFCAMNQQGSNKVLFSLDKEAALEFYASFKIAEKSLGPISTKTFEGYGALKCQYASVESIRQGFYCDLTGEGRPGPVAELEGANATALYKALKLPEVASEKGTTASLYIRCAKYGAKKYHCMVKTGKVSLAVVKGDAAQALYESLNAPEQARGAKTLKEFQGHATIECREKSCAVGFADAKTPPARKNP